MSTDINGAFAKPVYPTRRINYTFVIFVFLALSVLANPSEYCVHGTLSVQVFVFSSRYGTLLTNMLILLLARCLLANPSEYCIHGTLSVMFVFSSVCVSQSIRVLDTECFVCF